MNPMTAAVRSEFRAAIQGLAGVQGSVPAPPAGSPARLPSADQTDATVISLHPRSRRHRGGPVSRKDSGPVKIRLWLPLTPLFILLAPFALVLAPLLALVPEARGVNPYRAAFAIGGVLVSLSGTVVSVDAPDALIRIRIF